MGPSRARRASLSRHVFRGQRERLEEQLKLERIKVSQAAAELQQYCMQNACKTPCCLVSQLEATPSGSPDPELYCEDWAEGRWESTW